MGLGSGGLGRNNAAGAATTSSFTASTGAYEGSYGDQFRGASMYGDRTWQAVSSDADGSGSFEYGLGNPADVSAKDSMRIILDHPLETHLRRTAKSRNLKFFVAGNNGEIGKNKKKSLKEQFAMVHDRYLSGFDAQETCHWRQEEGLEKKHYGVEIGVRKKKSAAKKEGEREAPDAVTEEKKSNHVQRKLEKRQQDRKIDPHVEEQFASGRLVAAISSRPGQCGRAVGYILEGKKVEFYMKKLQKKKGRRVQVVLLLRVATHLCYIIREVLYPVAFCYYSSI
ncbi:40S ribosomal protein [Datura stramonium]|uniref:40S ribosomal protein n=1 Tax=Datura stramonium TaxID=4076 RepID=A0ABS8SBE2_DATST|nr:40S ribosomal protein [Datura stramonium]